MTTVQETKALLQNKNHDYDEAWRDMRISSITDIILMKLFRVKQIEDNEGQTGFRRDQSQLPRYD